MTLYIAVIGDLIQSRQLKNRRAIQKELQEVLKMLNHKYEDFIVSPFTLTIGDEFQVLLEVDGRLWELLDTLQISIPVPCRIGVGLGEIFTDINTEYSIGADGDVFWHARDAIDRVHKNNWNGKSHVLFRGPDNRTDNILNSLLLAGETLKSEWTDLQQQTFAQMLDAGIYTSDFKQNDFADAIGITNSSLSKRLNLGNIKVYLQLRETLSEVLESYYGNIE